MKITGDSFLTLLFFFGCDCIFGGAIMIYEAFKAPPEQSDFVPLWLRLGVAMCAVGVLLICVVVFHFNGFQKPQQ